MINHQAATRINHHRQPGVLWRNFGAERFYYGLRSLVPKII
jgi:hypothetical protein